MMPRLRAGRHNPNLIYLQREQDATTNDALVLVAMTPVIAQAVIKAVNALTRTHHQNINTFFNWPEGRHTNEST